MSRAGSSAPTQRRTRMPPSHLSNRRDSLNELRKNLSFSARRTASAAGPSTGRPGSHGTGPSAPAVWVQRDGADRRVLEAVIHGPRGDIINLYTTFPWPVMCREVAKLAITLPAPSLPQQPPQPPSRSTAVTSEARARGRWLPSVTPSGIEKGRTVTGSRAGRGNPPGSGSPGRPAAA